MATTRKQINYDLYAETTPEGIILSGKNTFFWKDTIKALGGKWQADTKTWILPVDTSLAPLMPVLPDWVCCISAHNLDHKNKTLHCPIHYPSGKNPWWFCGHKDARIVSMRTQMHTCRTCAGPDSYGCSYVRGINYAHND